MDQRQSEAKLGLDTIEDRAKLRALAAAERARLADSGMVGQCATSEPRPRVWDDPRGWAHDVCAHHAPAADGLDRIAAVRAAAENLIIEILRSCPDCGDRQQAVGTARVAMIFANASIALDGRV